MKWALSVVALVLWTVLLVKTASLEAYDKKPYYRPSEVPAIAERMGEAGRTTYLEASALDLIFAPTYCGLLFAFGARPIFPALLLTADLVETLGARTVVKAYPQPRPTVAAAMAVATPLKWIFLLLSIFGVIRRLRSAR